MGNKIKDGFEFYSDGILIVRFRKSDTKRLNEYINYINENKIDTLLLGTEREEPIENLNFLKKCPHIDGIGFLDSFKDFSGLFYLTKLTNLEVPEGKLDLSHFKHLEVLSGDWDKRISGLNHCKSMKEIHVDKFNPKSKDFSEMEGLDNLEKIYITYSSVSNLKGLKNLYKLKDITFNYFRNLESIKDLPVHLEELEMESCKKIKDHDTLSHLKKLEKLIMSKCGETPSLEFIKKMPKLKFFSFVDTNVLDGDMTLLLESGLEYAGFLNKRHYSHSSEEINDLLKAKNGESWLRKNKGYMFD